MNQILLPISERGQITIPKKIRTGLKSQFVSLKKVGNALVLEPVQTKDEFFAELEETYADWKEHGGNSLKEIKEKYDL